MQDEAEDGEEQDSDLFGAHLKTWRGKRSRREVGEALVAAMAALPDQEEEGAGRKIGVDHIRLWERGRAALPDPPTQRALAQVLGVLPSEVATAVGWEKVRRADALDFVRELVFEAQYEGAQSQADDLHKTEKRLLLAVRSLQPDLSVQDLTSVLLAQVDRVIPPEHLQDVHKAAGLGDPRGALQRVLWYMARLPPVVQQALWVRFFGTSVVPAWGMQHAGLSPDSTVSYLSGEAHLAALKVPNPEWERIKAEAAERWDPEKGTWKEGMEPPPLEPLEDSTSERPPGPSAIARQQRDEAFQKAKRRTVVIPLDEDSQNPKPRTRKLKTTHGDEP
jgi:hypothetical protein